MHSYTLGYNKQINFLWSLYTSLYISKKIKIIEKNIKNITNLYTNINCTVNICAHKAVDQCEIDLLFKINDEKKSTYMFY